MKKMDSATAMRETLHRTAKRLIAATEDDMYGDDVVYLVGCMRTVAADCRAALKQPPRNCDVGTEQEQGVRFNAFCKKDCDRCSACPKATKYGIETPCYLIWAQMPYQEGETDGSK